MNFRTLPLSLPRNASGVAAAWAALAPADRRTLARAYVELGARRALSEPSALGAFLAEALGEQHFANLRELTALRRAADARDAAAARAAIARIQLDGAEAQAEAAAINETLAGLAASHNRRVR